MNFLSFKEAHAAIREHRLHVHIEAQKHPVPFLSYLEAREEIREWRLAGLSCRSRHFPAKRCE